MTIFHNWSDTKFETLILGAYLQTAQLIKDPPSSGDVYLKKPEVGVHRTVIHAYVQLFILLLHWLLMGTMDRRGVGSGVIQLNRIVFIQFSVILNVGTACCVPFARALAE